MTFRQGDKIERHLEGMWFAAIVEKVYPKDEEVTLKYIDDGNVETNVPFEEIRLNH
jgi:hypothetical protein